MAFDDCLDGVESLREKLESAELGCRIAYRREPTQAEGDAHEAGEPAHAKGQCFVPMGGWTGRRCRICNRWVWGGPTVCVEHFVDVTAEAIGAPDFTIDVEARADGTVEPSLAAAVGIPACDECRAYGHGTACIRCASGGE